MVNEAQEGFRLLSRGIAPKLACLLSDRLGTCSGVAVEDDDASSLFEESSEPTDGVESLLLVPCIEDKLFDVSLNEFSFLLESSRTGFSLFVFFLKKNYN